MSSSENNSKSTQFQPGNKAAVKLDTPEKRLKAFESFCSHVSSGYPKEAFHYDDGEASCCHKTIEKYISEHAEEFPLHLLEKAKATRYKYWFNEGKTLMRGEYRNGSPVVWQTIMRNMFKDFGWDQQTIQQDNKSHVEKLAQSIRDGSFGKAVECDNGIEQSD